MGFLSALLHVLGGLGVLVVGGEILLRGAVGVATICRLTPAVIGLTVVAAGTSVPELAVSAVAAYEGKPDITVGNVVGSNIFNIALILGLVASYRRLTLSGNTIRLEYPALFLFTMLFIVVSRDAAIGRLEALLFLASYICFTAYMIRVVPKDITAREKKEFAGEVSELQPTPEKEPDLKISLGLLVGGVALLALGAEWCVSGAVVLGTLAGISERVIGLTIIGGGTGLPELVTSLVSSYRGRDDVAIANVIGSNIFNILCILGLTGLLSPIPVSEAIISSDNWWMLVATIVLFPIMKRGLDINRREGYFLLAFYGVYLLQLIFRPGV